MLSSVYDFLIVFTDSQPLRLFTQNQASKNSSMGEEETVAAALQLRSEWP